METAVTHWPRASLKQLVMDWNHVLGFMVLKDSPCDGVTS